MAFEIGPECISCGLCQRVCQRDAVVEEVMQFRILASQCHDCSDCLEVCPIDCICPVTQPEAGQTAPLIEDGTQERETDSLA